MKLLPYDAVNISGIWCKLGTKKGLYVNSKRQLVLITAANPYGYLGPAHILICRLTLSVNHPIPPNQFLVFARKFRAQRVKDMEIDAVAVLKQFGIYEETLIDEEVDDKNTIFVNLNILK